MGVYLVGEDVVVVDALQLRLLPHLFTFVLPAGLQELLEAHLSQAFHEAALLAEDLLTDPPLLGLVFQVAEEGL